MRKYGETLIDLDGQKDNLHNHAEQNHTHILCLP